MMNRGLVFKTCDDPESPNEGTCLGQMMNRNRHMRGVFQIYDELKSPEEGMFQTYYDPNSPHEGGVLKMYYEPTSPKERSLQDIL